MVERTILLVYSTNKWAGARLASEGSYMSAYGRTPCGGASRRALMICGLGLALSLAGTDGDEDAACVQARRWRDLRAEHHQLLGQWQFREAELFRDPEQLKSIQSNGHRSDKQLLAIEDRLDAIHWQREDLLSEILRTPASSRRGLLGRYGVLISLLEPDDVPEAAALAASIGDDIARCVPCGRSI
jgi:hypothetical protein